MTPRRRRHNDLDVSKMAGLIIFRCHRGCQDYSETDLNIECTEGQFRSELKFVSFVKTNLLSGGPRSEFKQVNARGVLRDSDCDYSSSISTMGEAV